MYYRPAIRYRCLRTIRVHYSCGWTGEKRVFSISIFKQKRREQIKRIGNENYVISHKNMQYNFFHLEIQSRNYGETRKNRRVFYDKCVHFPNRLHGRVKFRTNEPNRRSNRISPRSVFGSLDFWIHPSLVQGDLSNTTIPILYARTRDVHINLNRDVFENSYIRT